MSVNSEELVQPPFKLRNCKGLLESGRGGESSENDELTGHFQSFF